MNKDWKIALEIAILIFTFICFGGSLWIDSLIGVNYFGILLILITLKHKNKEGF